MTGISVAGPAKGGGAAVAHRQFPGAGVGSAKGFGEAKIEKWIARLGYLDEKELPISADTSRQRIVQATSRQRSGIWRVATMQKGQLDRAGVRLANEWIQAFQHRLQQFHPGYIS